MGVASLAAALALAPAFGQDSPQETADAATATPAGGAPAVAKPDPAATAARADPAPVTTSDPAADAKANPAASGEPDPSEDAKQDAIAGAKAPHPTKLAGQKAGPASKGKTRAPYISPTKFVPSQLKGVAGQCDNLMRLATVLKAEVEKTTMDVLSVGVVRDASQIEQLAHKMRDERGPQ